MLLARPADRYTFLKQSYLLAPILFSPDLVGLKAQIREIDSDFQKSNSAKDNGPGQADKAEIEVLGVKASIQEAKKDQIADLDSFSIAVDVAAEDAIELTAWRATKK